MWSRIVLVLMIAFEGMAPIWAQNPGAVSGDATTGYRIHVVSRSIEAVDYHRKGSTKVDLKGTDLMPEVKGEAKVEGKANGEQVEVSLEHLGPPHALGMAYLTYVLWAITPEGRTRNLGELIVKDGKAHIQRVTEFQAFALMVTAEPYFAVSEPSDFVVAQNVVRSSTKGGVEPIDVKYELISRDTYNAQVQPIDNAIFGIDASLPLSLLEARNAVRIVRDAGAEKYAPDTFQKAKDQLNQANDTQRRKPGNAEVETAARQAVQTAEETRLMTIKRQQEEQAAQERKAQEDRTAQAQLEAERQQAQAAQAQAQAQQEALRRQQEEQARQQAEQAQQQAAQQAQQAEQARQAADQARQQAENDKAQMRARMLQQLNQVLETRDTARGLIVNMPDVLFDIGKADLKSTARERLAKVAGILISYPDIRVEVDGYTDSTGSLDLNERLSQQRAETVQGYLSSQGVNSGAITAQGFGPNNPVASNDTAAGRQQNRRVEMVVSGASIGQATGQAPQ